MDTMVATHSVDMADTVWGDRLTMVAMDIPATTAIPITATSVDCTEVIGINCAEILIHPS